VEQSVKKKCATSDHINTDPVSTGAEPPDHNVLSRRGFFVRATQVGAALSVASPGISRFLQTAAAQGSLPHQPVGSADLVTNPSNYAELYSGLRWRMIGPFRGGRVDAVCGVVGRPNEFYFGAVNGGVWKSIDAGRVWEPVFDSQPVASIGALAVAPSAPDVVYVGSGESTLRDSVGYGNGMYKSVDAGKTWTHIGLENTQHIGKIAVDPHNPDIVFVAAIGHFYAGNPDRGIFRSRDGGKSWEKVLYKNENVGAVEVIIDPSNPKVIYAGLWNTRRPPWFVYAPSNGPGGGIYKSTDGGDTWKQLTSGLPGEGIGRTGIAVAASDPQRVYAVIDNLNPDPAVPKPTGPADPFGSPAGLGGFFRSDDGGATWKRLSADQALWGRGWYFEHIVVDPKDADIVYVGNVAVSRSMDGGKSWVALRGSPGGDDYHQLWVSPDDTNTMIVASDQGTIITRNAKTEDPTEVTWSSWYNQPISQLYHVSVDYRIPYWVTGAQQDTGAVAVRSRGKFAQISTRDWEPSGAGGESGFTAGDVLHPGIIFGGTGQRFNLEQNRAIAGTTAPQPPEKARTDWTQPLVFSKADPRALYYGNQYLFKTTDEAKTWTQISPDLTRANPGIPSAMDAAAAADVGNDRRGVVYTISPSPLLVPMVWIGTDDGLVQLTMNDGKSWTDVTPREVTPWSRITMMEASHYDFNVAYACVDRHQLQDFAPYIYRTRDAGKTWQKITSGLPANGYVHSVKEDPMRQGLLIAGTELGVHISFDDGNSWQPFQLNLPTTSMRDFEIYENDLIVGTHGRGIWILDDMSPLRQINDTIANADVYLFKPGDTVDISQGGDDGTPLQKDEPQAQNRPSGVAIDYYLKTAASGTVSIDVIDSAGAVLHTFTNEPGERSAAGGRRGNTGGIPNTSALWRQPPEPFGTTAGAHRVFWNPIKLDPAPAGAGASRRRGGGTPVSGTFTAKLTVAGKSYTQTFLVKPDPRGPTARTQPSVEG
jgi:photosystem II stability/assembly factor-like uncharacterized protein